MQVYKQIALRFTPSSNENYAKTTQKKLIQDGMAVKIEKSENSALQIQQAFCIPPLVVNQRTRHKQQFHKELCVLVSKNTLLLYFHQTQGTVR